VSLDTAQLHAAKQKPGRPLSRQAVYYHKVRKEIFDLLGRVCKKCQSTIDLEFDVIVPVGGPKSHHGKMSSTSRAAFYKRQLAAKNLQVLCAICNGGKKDTVESVPENKPLTIVQEGGTLMGTTVTNQTV
jgi:hypothetical protein